MPNNDDYRYYVYKDPDGSLAVGIASYDSDIKDFESEPDFAFPAEDGSVLGANDFYVNPQDALREYVQNNGLQNQEVSAVIMKGNQISDTESNYEVLGECTYLPGGTVSVRDETTGEVKNFYYEAATQNNTDGAQNDSSALQPSGVKPPSSTNADGKQTFNFVDIKDTIDTSANSTYNVMVGDTEATLIYGEDGTYKLIDRDGKEINKEEFDEESIVVINEKQYRTNADTYATLTGTQEAEEAGSFTENEGTEKMTKTNIGSRNRADQHDEFMHHTHVTQTSGSDDRGVEYEPGKTVTLANNPYLETHLATTGNILDPDRTKKTESFSKYDYIATYAATGQYSVQDLLLTANALEQEYNVKFAAHPDHYLKGTGFQKILEENREIDSFKGRADTYRSEVSQMKDDFQKLHDNITDWMGSASTEAKKAMQCVLGKFEVTMGNIENALEASCEAADNLIETLKELEIQEGVLEGYKAELEDAKLNRENNEPATRTGTKTVTYTGEDGETHEKEETYTYTDPEWSRWDKEVKRLEALIEEHHTKIMEPLLYDALRYKYQIDNFEKAIETFKSFFNGSRSHMIKDAASVVNYHDEIVGIFESVDTNPVITNLSDYELGDAVIHDDAHGFVYKVTGEFDPLTGTIKIACYDKDGNRRGSDVTIWDQREIVPIGRVRGYDEEYKEYPDKFTEPPTERTTERTTEHHTEHHTERPTGRPTTPPTTPPTNPPTVGPIIPPDDPTPAAPTEPHEGGIHTGLEGTFGDTSQSSTGLGALAGLAAGAAGLGLTGLMGDKEEKEEKAESEETKIETNEEVKPDSEDKKEPFNTENPAINQVIYPNYDQNK